jgi:hypothetical protein
MYAAQEHAQHRWQHVLSVPCPGFLRVADIKGDVGATREQVVDCQVVAFTGARKPYLHALLEIAGTRGAMMLPAPLFLVESQLARRVASLMKEVHMSKPRLIASLVIALTVLVATGWWAATTFWLVAPLGSPTHMVGYAYAPGSDGPFTAFMLYLVKDTWSRRWWGGLHR